MSDAIIRASLHENPPSNTEDPAMDISPIITNQLLTLLMDSLNIGENSTPDSEKSLLEVDSTITSFLATVVSKKGIWGKTKSMTRSILSNASDVDYAILQQRHTDLQQHFLDERQFRYMALMCVRKYDREHHYHCSTRRCKSDCPYFPYVCVNDRCTVSISQKYQEAHDDVCGWKILACTRGCGDHIPRKELDKHLLVTNNATQAHLA
jgi:hypothetical protein